MFLKLNVLNIWNNKNKHGNGQAISLQPQLDKEEDNVPDSSYIYLITSAIFDKHEFIMI